MSNEMVKLTEEERDISDLMIDWMVLSEGLSDQQADWLPFLVFGMPYAQIAKIFGCDKSNITHVLNNRSNGLAEAVAKGRKMVKRQLHYIWLDQKAVQAWRNIDEVLNADPFEKDDNGNFVHESTMRRLMFNEKSKMSRFVIQQLGLHVQRHEVTHSAPPPMFMGDDSLAKLVVERVTLAMNTDPRERNPEVIAGDFRVIDESAEKMQPTEEEKEIEPPYEDRGGWNTRSVW